MQFEALGRPFFLRAIQQYVNWILPPKLRKDIRSGSATSLIKAVPILKSTSVDRSFSVVLLCASSYTDGVGRYLCDTLSRWLVPGKNLSISGGMSLNLTFESVPDHNFYFEHLLVSCLEEEIPIIEQNLPALLEEIRLNIMAVYQARYIASLRSVSLDHKHLIIRENLTKILNLPSQETDRSLFDQMHNFLLKVSGEEKMGQVKRTIAHLMQARPKAFDREVFYEMTHFTILFKEQFASKRAPRHISRVIALHYLFKKVLLEAVHKQPTQRHISLKVLNTFISGTQPVVGLLVGINTLRESERFDKKFLLDAIRACLPDVEYVKDSYTCDQRDDKVTVLYLEISNPSFIPFTKGDIKTLRQRLNQELKKQTESDVHPIFLPRNEEDVARNLILLSQQLKFSRDLPQVSIHYEKQTESEILFSVLLARLMGPASQRLRDLIEKTNSPFKFYVEEARQIGTLKRRIPKEAAILRVSLDKAPFFRLDYSVDLLRARQKVAYELSRIIGEYRDFNGGMILKQEESLLALRQQIGPMQQSIEFLLEDYFYSLRPGVMQTVLPPEILKEHFALLQTLQHRSTEEPFEMLEKKIEHFSLYFIGAVDAGFKDRLDIEVEKLNLPSYELARCFIQFKTFSSAGYILRTEDSALADNFKKALQRALSIWTKLLLCPVKAS